MANREIVPNSLYPLQGDVISTAGSSTALVEGIQGVPIETVVGPITDQSTLVYDASATLYRHKIIPANQSVEINGVPVSDDFDIAVNLPLGVTGTPVLVNGV